MFFFFLAISFEDVATIKLRIESFLKNAIILKVVKSITAFQFGNL